MKVNRWNLSLLWLTPLFLIMMHQQSAKADWYDFLKDFGGQIRANTTGRIYDQTYLGELSPEEVRQYRERWGGDAEAKFADWCSQLAYDQGWRNPIGSQIPYLNTTHREENGKVNCYSRNR